MGKTIQLKQCTHTKNYNKGTLISDNNLQTTIDFVLFILMKTIQDAENIGYGAIFFRFWDCQEIGCKMIINI